MTFQKTIHNVITGEIITRDYNETEIAELEADQATAKKEATAKAKADKIKTEKRQIILDRLGITNDELLEILS